MVSEKGTKGRLESGGQQRPKVTDGIRVRAVGSRSAIGATAARFCKFEDQG